MSAEWSLLSLLGVAAGAWAAREVRYANRALRALRRQSRPGSPAAIAHGCTCSAQENRGGRGLADVNGVPVYHFRADCPLHGRGDWRD